MFLFRLGRCLISCLAFALPSCALWGLMLSYAASPGDPTVQSKIPSPAKAPAWMVGPSDVLVYADPSFAGTAWLWLFLWGVAAATLLLLALCLPIPV